MSVSGFACLCIFPPFVRGGNKALNKQVRESDSLSDTEDSSTTGTIRTQRFLIKRRLLSFKKGNGFKKEAQRTFLKASPSANEKSGLSRAKRGGESPDLQGESPKIGETSFCLFTLDQTKRSPFGAFQGTNTAQAVKRKL